MEKIEVNEKRLCLFFDHGCFPLWYAQKNANNKELYWAAGEELYNDEILSELLDPLQEEYDSLCFDDEGGFDAHGFESVEHMKSFNKRMLEAWEKVVDYLGSDYEVAIRGFFNHPNSVIARSPIPII